MAEAITSVDLELLLDNLRSVVVDLFTGKEAIFKLVQKLKVELSMAVAWLKESEVKVFEDPGVKKWLDEVKDTVYDADDLAYKINTEALRTKLEGKSQSNYKVMTKLNPTSFTAFDHKAIKRNIEEILERLEAHPSRTVPFRFRLTIGKQRLPERVTTPFVEESCVYGRDKDKEAIIKLLLSDEASGKIFCVISIVGMGGIGKTTLAQLVSGDERVYRWFDTKVWVTVGNDDKIDSLNGMKAIIWRVTKSETFKFKEQFVLLDEMKRVLSGKKFLLVLDNVWDEDPHSWDVLKNSFQSGLHGSKIVVTTRSKIVASIMVPGSTHYLEGVSYEDGWQLFAKHALIDANLDEQSDLQVIGRNIVDKCKGLPLAIKSFGGLFRGTLNKEEWNKKWELYESGRIPFFKSLWLSYYHLPLELKRCFAYCALFPKNYKFEKEKIILLWMAEGFLHPQNGKRMEEIGEEYFQNLVLRSFFQPSNEKRLDHFKMHDLMHDLAIFISGQFCSEINDARFSYCGRKIRHLSCRGQVDDPEKFESLSEAKGLRTFLTLPVSGSSKSWASKMDQLFESLLRTKSCLRVLSVADEYYITKLPDSIGYLKYLKYLEIDCPRIVEIPNIICYLYNLETLLLEKCLGVKRLPNDIGNLINLRHLKIPPFLEEMPLQIGELRNLQTLNRFVVGKNSESGIKLLEELQKLHGTIHISGLENVDRVEDVSKAQLKKKEFLSELNLSWGYYSRSPDYLQKGVAVLDAFEPHANLNGLSIVNYRGSSFPEWIGNGSFSNVVSVHLQNWKKCSLLPPLGQLPSLKHLDIWGFDGVKEITSTFYYSNPEPPAVVGITPFRSLESLRFLYMSELRKWSFIKKGVFPRLKKLIFGECPSLKVSLPDCLPSLRELRINKCDKLLPLDLSSQQAVDDAFPSFESLKICSCRGQDSLLEGGLPSSLKKIEISSCPKLKTLDEETFQCLNSLEELEIQFCDYIQCLPKVLPTSLSHLSIKRCYELERRLRRDTGEDWPIIAHIPNIHGVN